MAESSDMDILRYPPQNGVLPDFLVHFPRFFQKPSCFTFVPSWCPKFKQKTEKLKSCIRLQIQKE